jgi:hypothetical protein
MSATFASLEQSFGSRSGRKGKKDVNQFPGQIGSKGLYQSLAVASVIRGSHQNLLGSNLYSVTFIAGKSPSLNGLSI